MLFTLANECGSDIYQELVHSALPRVVKNDKVFVAWSKHLINKGNYFYGFSHIPAHELDLPEDTFTFTVIRDPVKRVTSHYKMIMEYKVLGKYSGKMERESKWFVNNFSDFYSNMPRKDLLRQLYMFSKSFDVNEAYDRIINCSHFFLTENFSQGVELLSQKLEIPLKPVHARKTSNELEENIGYEDIESLKVKLKPEIELYEKLKAYLG
jgi:hypothetical protein